MISLSDWLNYIETLHPREIELGLERIETLAQSLSLTQFSCPVITVAGTNGKGSIVRCLENTYLKAGYRVAAYTSPHIIRFNERLRINNQEIADNDWLAAFEIIENSRGEQALSFFEFTTLAALYICQQHTLDVLILEVGLGGRLDAVNVVNLDVAVISNIAMDHMDWLGFDRESIGREKAGIIRNNKPVVCGDPEPPQTLLEIANASDVGFYCFNKDFCYRVAMDSWEWEGPSMRYFRLPFPCLKLQNIATSLMVVELLQSQLPVTQYAVITGINKLDLPGRFEQVNHFVNIIYDVAHNPQSMAYLAKRMKSLPRKGKVLAVTGMLRNKEIGKSIEALVPVVDAWYVADLKVPRGTLADEILSELTARGVKNCYNFASVSEALRGAMEQHQGEDVILVFGSFYTVGMAKQAECAILSKLNVIPGAAGVIPSEENVIPSKVEETQ